MDWQAIIENDEIKSIFGVPLEEARKVLILYKAGIDNVNRNYAKGFEDGYKRAMEDYERQLIEIARNLSKGIGNDK